MKSLQEKIRNIGLFCAIPVVGKEETIRTVEALARGEIYGLILPWHKKVTCIVEQVHKRFPQLLIAVQGPYTKACSTFASGIGFITDTQLPTTRIQVPFFLRQGTDLLADTRPLAKCSNKIVSSRQIKQQCWEAITSRAKQAVQEMLGFELQHIGINHSDDQAANQTAQTFDKLFGFTQKDKGGAFFAGPYIEAMKKIFRGKQGHIAIATNHADRAAWYLTQRGATINWKTADYNPDGSLRVVYLQEEIGGFAVHILQK